MLSLRYEPAAVTRWRKTLDDDRRAPLPCRKISFSHGAEWKALISKYIETIPVSGDASCVAEQSMSGEPPPWIPVKQRHDCEGWRGRQRYPVGRAKRGVRLLASILIHMKPKPIQ
jgi:hypothetical protein